MAVPDWDPGGRWTVGEAVRIQRRMAGRVRLAPLEGAPRWIAGADVSYDRGGDRLYAAVVVTEARTGREVARSADARRVEFPYIPGLLSFREVPAVLAAWRGLAVRPDVLICDGQGLAHPRRFGLACHLGCVLDVPAIGCAKSRLVGTHREPGRRRGCRTALRDGRDRVGTVLRTRDGARPLFVSPGHRVDFRWAERVVLSQCRGVRLPEPIRLAHRAVNELRRRG